MNRVKMRIAIVALVATMLAATALLAGSAAGHDANSARAPEQSITGTLALNASLALTSRIGACPTPPGADDCALRTISGLFPGLGSVTGTYEFYVKTAPPPCGAGLGKALAYPIRFAVASKEDITVAVAEGPCTDQESIRTQTQSFTVTEGTGIYAGVSGSGSLAGTLGADTGTGRSGQEQWTGTLTVPGLEFDTTRPTLSNATRKTVRAKKGAKSASVVFRVTAQDDKDGPCRSPALRDREVASSSVGRGSAARPTTRAATPRLRHSSSLFGERGEDARFAELTGGYTQRRCAAAWARSKANAPVPRLHLRRCARTAHSADAVACALHRAALRIRSASTARLERQHSVRTWCEHSPVIAPARAGHSSDRTPRLDDSG